MLRTVLILYRKQEAPEMNQRLVSRDGFFAFSMTALIALNLLLGLLGGPILNIIQQGLQLFA
jgi:hypothetical protein